MHVLIMLLKLEELSLSPLRLNVFCKKLTIVLVKPVLLVLYKFNPLVI